MGRIHIDGADTPGKFKPEIQIGPKDVTNFYDAPIMKDGKPLTVDGKLVTVHDNMYKDLRQATPQELLSKGIDLRNAQQLITQHDQLVGEVYNTTKTGPIAPDSPLAQQIGVFKQDFGNMITQLHGKP